MPPDSQLVRQYVPGSIRWRISNGGGLRHTTMQDVLNCPGYASKLLIARATEDGFCVLEVIRWATRFASCFDSYASANSCIKALV